MAVMRCRITSAVAHFRAGRVGESSLIGCRVVRLVLVVIISDPSRIGLVSDRLDTG